MFDFSCIGQMAVLIGGRKSSRPLQRSWRLEQLSNCPLLRPSWRQWRKDFFDWDILYFEDFDWTSECLIEIISLMRARSKESFLLLRVIRFIPFAKNKEPNSKNSWFGHGIKINRARTIFVGKHTCFYLQNNVRRTCTSTVLDRWVISAVNIFFTGVNRAVIISHTGLLLDNPIILESLTKTIRLIVFAIRMHAAQWHTYCMHSDSKGEATGAYDTRYNRKKRIGIQRVTTSTRYRTTRNAYYSSHSTLRST